MYPELQNKKEMRNLISDLGLNVHAGIAEEELQNILEQKTNLLDDGSKGDL